MVAFPHPSSPPLRGAGEVASQMSMRSSSPAPLPRSGGEGAERGRPPMEKRVIFNDRLLPYLLVAPQMIITLVFFFWPSGQAIWQSVLIEDAFGGNSKFVWFDNFTSLLKDPAYYDLVAHHAGVQLPGGGAGPGALAAAGGDGRPHHPRRLGLQDDPGVALCRGAGRRRRAVRLSVQSRRSAPCRGCSRASASTSTTSPTATRR